jgi:AcrR family transcriptional regulator
MVPRPSRRLPAAIDDEVRAAVRQLVTEQGYQAMTIEGVAARAGVAKTVIYRRWRSKAEMVFELVVHGQSVEPPADEGALAGDLRALVSHVLALLTDSAVRGALPGLLADLRSDDELGERFRVTVINAERSVVERILDRARSRGEINADVGAGHVHAQLLGTIFAWVYLIDGDLPPTLTDDITAALLALTKDPTRGDA